MGVLWTLGCSGGEGSEDSTVYSSSFTTRGDDGGETLGDDASESESSESSEDSTGTSESSEDSTGTSESSESSESSTGGETLDDESTDDGDPTTGGGGGTPCEGGNDPKQTLACGQQIQQNFAGLFGDLDQACGHAFPWQDNIIHFVGPDGGATVTASYTVQGGDPGDGAVFVLEGACSEGSCVASSLDVAPHTAVTFEALGGVDYWFVYEAPSQQPTYNIYVNCE